MIDEALIEEILRRLREAAPEATRIVLFGSAACGATDENSDVDVLMVVPRADSRMVEGIRLRGALRGLRTAFDIVVVTEDDIADVESLRGSIVYDALTEGRALHAA